MASILDIFIFSEFATQDNSATEYCDTTPDVIRSRAEYRSELS